MPSTTHPCPHRPPPHAGTQHSAPPHRCEGATKTHALEDSCTRNTGPLTVQVQGRQACQTVQPHAPLIEEVVLFRVVPPIAVPCTQRGRHTPAPTPSDNRKRVSVTRETPVHRWPPTHRVRVTAGAHGPRGVRALCALLLQDSGSRCIIVAAPTHLIGLVCPHLWTVGPQGRHYRPCPKHSSRPPPRPWHAVQRTLWAARCCHEYIVQQLQCTQVVASEYAHTRSRDTSSRREGWAARGRCH